MHQSTTKIFFFVLESAFCDKNMLLVPKNFVTVPDNVPEILINLSHPWTYTCFQWINRLYLK